MRQKTLPLIMILGGLASLLVATSCEDDESNKPTLACPEGGIGVSAADGTACNSAAAVAPNSPSGEECGKQVASYKDFKCSTPQICVDQGKRRLPFFVVDPLTPPQEASFIVTNCSTGKEKLTISKISLAGDSRCSFSEPEIEKKELNPGESMVVRTIYNPKQLGDDHAAIRVLSNAENFPTFVIPVCGRGISKPIVYEDGGVTANDGGVTAPDAGTSEVWDCQDVGTTINSTCHKE